MILEFKVCIKQLYFLDILTIKAKELLFTLETYTSSLTCSANNSSNFFISISFEILNLYLLALYQKKYVSLNH